jgi:hypothetical protein
LKKANYRIDCRKENFARQSRGMKSCACHVSLSHGDCCGFTRRRVALMFQTAQTCHDASPLGSSSRPAGTPSKDQRCVSSSKSGKSTDQTSFILFLRSSMLISLIASNMGSGRDAESALSEVFRSILLQMLTLTVLVWFHLRLYVAAAHVRTRSPFDPVDSFVKTLLLC